MINHSENSTAGVGTLCEAIINVLDSDYDSAMGDFTTHGPHVQDHPRVSTILSHLLHAGQLRPGLISPQPISEENPLHVPRLEEVVMHCTLIPYLLESGPASILDQPNNL